MLEGDHATSCTHHLLYPDLFHPFGCTCGYEIHKVDTSDQQNQYTDDRKKYNIFDPAARLNTIIVSIIQIAIGKWPDEKLPDPMKVFFSVLRFEFLSHKVADLEIESSYVGTRAESDVSSNGIAVPMNIHRVAFTIKFIGTEKVERLRIEGCLFEYPRNGKWTAVFTFFK